jgi:hypothetical protein
MDQLNAITIIGLIGVTLVVAVGKIFEPAREWLKGFAHPWNPLRILGEGMSCTMCAGWWVGFWWGIYSGDPIITSVVVGGLVSVLSYLSDELLAIVAAVSIRLVRRAPPAPQIPAPMPRAPRVPDQEPAITEDDADRILDEENDRADESGGQG